jgi:hypothetical protein
VRRKAVFIRHKAAVPGAISACTARALSGSRRTTQPRRNAMTQLKAFVASALIVLSSTGCEVAVEALPAAYAEPGMEMSGPATEFSAMHAAIPAGTGSDIQDYQ